MNIAVFSCINFVLISTYNFTEHGSNNKNTSYNVYYIFWTVKFGLVLFYMKIL